jgi:hypothetical protein
MYIRVTPVHQVRRQLRGLAAFSETDAAETLSDRQRSKDEDCTELGGTDMDVKVRWIRKTAANGRCQLCTCQHDTLMLYTLDDAGPLGNNDGTNDGSTPSKHTQ